MKIAVLNDTHAGVRGDMLEMAKYQGRFFNEIFFPYLDENNIKQIIHLGDYFDRRKYINFASLKANREHFIEPMLERDIQMDLVIGNHDTYYKNTNDVNAPELVLFNHKNINVYSEPVVKEYDGYNIALVPWINPDNYADSVEFLLTANAATCMGHFEIEGAMMNPQVLCHNGLDHTYLKRFDEVYSGHFHHKSILYNITYLGAQMQFTWNDYGDEKYFHIFDTETTIMSPIHNPIKMFEKAFYDDTKYENFEAVQNLDYEQYANKFVKIIVVDKDNPYWFDSFCDKVYAVNPIHVSIVDDNKHMDFMDDDIENVEDTLTILNTYIDGLEIQGKKKELQALMTTLYHEALDEHTYL